MYIVGPSFIFNIFLDRCLSPDLLHANSPIFNGLTFRVPSANSRFSTNPIFFIDIIVLRRLPSITAAPGDGYHEDTTLGVCWNPPSLPDLRSFVLGSHQRAEGAG
jgi:hypothetical protein